MLKMIGRILDKLVFGATLLIALQIPLLLDHYQQFLSGLYESTRWQVEGYEETAMKYEYASVLAMIRHHLQNDVKSVREDAQQKLATLERYEDLRIGMRLFASDQFIEKVVYVFNPSRYSYLQKTVQNFQIGIPLSATGFAFGVVSAVIINLIVTWPIAALSKRIRRRKRRTDTSPVS